MRALWIVALAMAVLLAQPHAARADRRVALVIGNSHYVSTAPLPNPRNDAGDVAAALKRVGFDVVDGYDLDKRGMDEAFRRFARLADGADAALVYYAGHGLQYQGVNYLMPVDAKLESETDLTYEMARVDGLMADLQRAGGVKILMLDACRDNPLAQALQRRIARTRSIAPTRGLAPIERTAGAIIAYATQAGDVAADGSDRNSPFAKAFLAHVEEPGLEVARLFRLVARDVNAATKGVQLPEVSLSLLGDFYFTPPAGDGTASRPAAEAALPAALPAPAMRSTPAGDPAAEQAAAACDRLAASPQDIDRPSGVAGVELNRLDIRSAVEACTAAVRAAPDERRLLFALARAYGAGNEGVSAREWDEKAAAAGSLAAMNDLAFMLEKGEGGPADIARAASLFERAASAGNVPAMRNLGLEYENGSGRTRDAAKAAEWYRKAADMGDPQAMGFLAVLQLQGTGVPKDAGAARGWIDKVIATEHTPSILRVGFVLLGTTGAVKDYRTARELFEKAAALGDADGLVMLGNMAATGLGMPRDIVAARRLFEKAAAAGSASGKASLMPFYITGLGGAPRNADRAAALGLEALRAGSPVARSFLLVDWRTSLDPAARIAVERRLSAAGLLKRTADGSYGSDTLQALESYARDRPN